MDSLVEEARAAQPHPVAIVESPIGIQELIIKPLRSLFPAHPKVTPSEEACHGMPVWCLGLSE